MFPLLTEPSKQSFPVVLCYLCYEGSYMVVHIFRRVDVTIHNTSVLAKIAYLVTFKGTQLRISGIGNGEHLDGE